jgi:valyl-tRNA synthetase
VTEEVWSWWHSDGSIHRQTWPALAELNLGTSPAGQNGILEAAREVIGEIRRAKTEAGVSLRAPVATATVVAPADTIARVQAAADDLRQAGAIADLRLIPADPPSDAITVQVELA